MYVFPPAEASCITDEKGAFCPTKQGDFKISCFHLQAMMMKTPSCRVKLITN